MARRKVEAKILEIDTALRDCRKQLEDAEFDLDEAETRVLYYQDQIRRLKFEKQNMTKSKLKD